MATTKAVEPLRQCGGYMPLYFCRDRPFAVSLRNRGRCVACDFAEPRGVAGFDLVPERRPLTISDRRVAWRRGSAYVSSCLDGDVAEPGRT